MLHSAINGRQASSRHLQSARRAKSPTRKEYASLYFERKRRISAVLMRALGSRTLVATMTYFSRTTEPTAQIVILVVSRANRKYSRPEVDMWQVLGKPPPDFLGSSASSDLSTLDSAKGPGERRPNMLTRGCDYHLSMQQIAWVDTETGE